MVSWIFASIVGISLLYVIYTSENPLLTNLHVSTRLVDSSGLCLSVFSRRLCYCTSTVALHVVLFTSAVCPNGIKWIRRRRLFLYADMLMCQLLHRSLMSLVWGTYIESCWFESSSHFLTITTIRTSITTTTTRQQKQHITLKIRVWQGTETI